jgi:hypothetical protein
MSKIARTLGALVIAGAPFLMSAAPASATGGCTASNTSTTSHNQASVTVDLSTVPPTVTTSFNSSNTSCSYVSGGGTVEYKCDLIANGECTIFKNGSAAGFCIATCEGQFEAVAGDVIRVEVYGGTGSAHDLV